MPYPPPRRTQGFTLIEMLVAVALLAGLFYAVGPLLTRSTQANRQTVLAAGTNTSLTRLGEQVAHDIRGGETLLARASTTSLDMYKIRDQIRFNLTPGSDRYQGKTLHILDNAFASSVGKQVMIIGSQGEYMPTRVLSSTPQGTGSVVAFDCNMNMPGGITAFTFGGLKLEMTPQGLARTRTENGVPTTQLVATNLSKLTFKPTYGATAGTFATTPKAPTPRVSDQKLDGVNYALTSGDEQPVLAAGYVPLGLPGIYPWPCDANPVAPPNNLGKLGLNVTLNGELAAPATLRPTVYVSGPGLSTTVATFGARVFDKIAAGTYVSSADPITAGSTIYDPRVGRSPARIGNGLQETIFVDYTIRKGRVTVQVTGLPTPPPSSGLVTFTGPETVQVPAQTGSQEIRLTPGTYGVNADPVGAYVPTVSTSTLTVGSTTNTVVTVNYAIPKGAVNIQVTGLPATYNGGSFIRLSGPETATAPAVNGTSNVTLQPGQYTVQADDAGTYKPAISATVIQVNSNQTTTVQITYTDPTPPDPGSPTLPGTSPGSPPPPGPPSLPDPKNTVTMRFNAGFSDRNITRLTLRNVNTGQAWWIDIQSFVGRSAGSRRIGNRKYSWEALPANTVMGEIKVPSGRYMVQEINTKGKGYSVVAVGIKVDRNTNQIKIINPRDYENSFNTYKSISINSQFDVSDGDYEFTTGVDPNISGGFASGGQWINVECGGNSQLIIEFGCVSNN